MKTPEETAEEFLIRQGCQRMDCDGENCNFFEDVQPKDLIEFAKWQQEDTKDYLQGFIDLHNNELDHWDAVEFLEWLKLNDFKIVKK